MVQRTKEGPENGQSHSRLLKYLATFRNTMHSVLRHTRNSGGLLFYRQTRIPDNNTYKVYHAYSITREGIRKDKCIQWECYSQFNLINTQINWHGGVIMIKLKCHRAQNNYIFSDPRARLPNEVTKSEHRCHPNGLHRPASTAGS